MGSDILRKRRGRKLDRGRSIQHHAQRFRGDGEFERQHLGNNVTDSFLRLFGDNNGDGSVAPTPDFNAFKATLGSSSGDSNYLAQFDSNADGSVAPTPDFNSFKARLGTQFFGFTVTM